MGASIRYGPSCSPACMGLLRILHPATLDRALFEPVRSRRFSIRHPGQHVEKLLPIPTLGPGLNSLSFLQVLPQGGGENFADTHLLGSRNLGCAIKCLLRYIHTNGHLCFSQQSQEIDRPQHLDAIRFRTGKIASIESEDHGLGSRG